MPASPFSQRRAGRGLVSLLGGLALGCGGDDNSAATPLGPSGEVELEITGFVNDHGRSFAADADSVTLSCDGSISVRVGPRDGAGGLNNWLLRPPGTCESFEQCGFVQLTFSSQTGVQRRVAGATTTLRVAAPPGDYDVLAELLTDEAEPFLQDELPVQARLENVVFIEPDDCDTSASSSGGSGGSERGRRQLRSRGRRSGCRGGRQHGRGRHGRSRRRRSGVNEQHRAAQRFEHTVPTHR